MIRRLLFALTALAPLVTPAAAQTAVPLLVEVDWVAQHAGDRNLVLLHLDSPADYAAQHIAGARQISDRDFTQGDYDMPPADTLRTKLAALGVSDDSHVVVYFGRTAAPQSATRLVFTLDYLGLGARTSLMNGGLPAWLRANKPVTTDVPQPVAGKLTAKATRPIIVDAEFVKTVGQKTGHRLVDGRAPVFYKGIEATHGVEGHIPGAISIPFTEILDAQRLIDPARVEKLFRDAGVKPGETVVGYCHVGQQATLMLFGARLLGHPVMLYDGSFMDWSMNKRGPAEK